MIVFVIVYLQKIIRNTRTVIFYINKLYYFGIISQYLVITHTLSYAVSYNYHYFTSKMIFIILYNTMYKAIFNYNNICIDDISVKLTLIFC